MPDRRSAIPDSSLAQEGEELVELLSLPRDRMLEELRVKGQRAATAYQELKARVDADLLQLEPVHVLGAAALALVVGAAQDGPGRVPYLGQFHVELLQALLLRHPEAAYKGFIGTPDQVQKALDMVKGLGEARMSMPWADHPGSASGAAARMALVENMRMHTLTIRGDFYHEQLTRFFRPILLRVAGAFRAVHGVAPGRLLDVMFALAGKVEQRLNDHIRALRHVWVQDSAARVLRAYGESFPATRKMDEADVSAAMEAAGGRLETLKYMLLAHSDLRVPDIFRISVAEVEKVVTDLGAASDAAAIVASLAVLSMRFGDLATSEFDRLPLDNPVWRRPLIQEGTGWFWPNPSSTVSFAPAIFYDLASQDVNLKASFETARAEVLESSVENLLREAFPAAQVWQGVSWRDLASGKAYENDTVVLLAGWLLVVEAKSGQLSAPARRGSYERLRRDVKKLLVDAAEQSARFVGYVMGAAGPVQLPASSGAVCRLDPGEIKGVLRLTITLDDMGHFSARGGDLRDGGLVGKTEEFVPTMSLSMFDVVVKALADQSAIVHYLKRRTELEQTASYTGDELDLLAFYLRTGFNIGQAEFGEASLMLYNLSKALDASISRLEDKPCPSQPKPTTPFWERLLQRLSTDHSEGWLHLSLRLRNFALEHQGVVERSMRAAGRKVQRRGYQVRAGQVGPEARRETFVTLVYGAQREQGKLERDLEQAFDGVNAGASPSVLLLRAAAPVTASSLRVGLAHNKAELVQLVRAAEL